MDVDAQLMPDGAGTVDQASVWIARHWLLVFNLGMALFVGGTLLAPTLMHLGLEGPARAVYTVYGLNCHQLPERSYFLFGPDRIDTYSLEQVLEQVLFTTTTSLGYGSLSQLFQAACLSVAALWRPQRAERSPRAGIVAVFLVHVLELTIDAFVQAYLYTQPLATPVRTETARHQEPRLGQLQMVNDYAVAPREYGVPL